MDYFSHNNRSRRNSAAQNQMFQQQDPENPPQRPGARYIRGAPSFESMSLRAPSNIRIRRLPSSTAVNQLRPATHEGPHTPSAIQEDVVEAGRRRSSSAPQRPNLDQLYAQDLARQRTVDVPQASRMPAIREGEQATPTRGSLHPGYSQHGHLDGRDGSRPTTPGIDVQDMAMGTPPPERVGATGPAMHSAGNAAQRARGFGLSRFRSSTASTAPRDSRPVSQDEYESDVIDLLDLVDPEVRAIGTLTNLQNSLFVPDLGGLVNRRPTYELSRQGTGAQRAEEDLARIARSRAGTRASRTQPPIPPPVKEETPMPVQDEATRREDQDIELQQVPEIRRTISISSELSDSHYAVLPHGVSLEGWADEDVAELNDHVRHLLHSKREGFKRSMRGFKQYISKPLGLFVFVYATLVTLFGAAWVFALIGWIYVGNHQDYIINIIDLTLVALFALIGDGLAPFRAVDTYHMCFIAHYHHLTWRLRREQKLPELVDQNDLPDRRRSATEAELEDAIDKEEMSEFSVLSPIQQKRLQYHQAKFNKSHTFYKPHETATHHAFPLRLMVAAVVLLDCHSLLQVALGTCTWSINYHVRPAALTATILSCSITCNIAAGIVISVGDHKTRKKDVLERIFRQGLTEQALKRMAKKHDRGKLALSVDPKKVQSEDIKDAYAQATGESSSDEPPAERSKSKGQNKTETDSPFYTPAEYS